MKQIRKNIIALALGLVVVFGFSLPVIAQTSNNNSSNNNSGNTNSSNTNSSNANSSNSASSNERAAGEPSPLKVPAVGVNEKRREVSLIVIATNKKTGRFLGDVSLSFTDLTTQTTDQAASQNNSYKTPDPPTPDGYIISPILSGQYELIAKRTGYEISDEKITIPADKQYYQLKIELTPLVGTPQPDEQNYNYLGNNNTVYNPVYNNPNYQNYPLNYLNNYPNNLNNNPINYPYSNTYYQTANQNYTVPLQITVLTQLSDYQTPATPQIQIIDPNNNNNQIILSSPQFQTLNGTTFTGGTGSSNQFGCLEPYHQYIVYVISNNFGMGTSPQNRPFQTGPQGQPIQITIDIRYLSNYPSINISFPTINQQLPFICPNFGNPNINYNNYNGINYNGPSIWTDPNINLNNFNNYTVFHSPVDGKYYLINRQNQFDVRPITFVDRGDGLGGLAFIPAQSGAYQNNIYPYIGSGNRWYVTIYTRSNNSDNLNLSIQYLSAVKFSPQDYANAVHSQVINSFAK